MADSSVLERLTPILREIFDSDDLVATADLTADRVNGWDSLTNIRLFLAVEVEFELHFSAAEISGLMNVGELADLIVKKQRR